MLGDFLKNEALRYLCHAIAVRFGMSFAPLERWNECLPRYNDGAGSERDDLQVRLTSKKRRLDGDAEVLSWIGLLNSTGTRFKVLWHGQSLASR